MSDIYQQVREATSFPDPQQVFSLPLSSDMTSPQGVVLAAHLNPKMWTYVGEQLNGWITKECIVLPLGDYKGLVQAGRKATGLGRSLVNGVFILPLTKMYPPPGEHVTILCGDSKLTWRNKRGELCIPGAESNQKTWRIVLLTEKQLAAMRCMWLLGATF